MIVFRAMRDSEFEHYTAYFISDYTDEIAKNFKLSPQLASELARSELARDLPEGPRTANQHLFCLLNQTGETQTHVGYIWYKREESADNIFVCDFHILPAFQNQGLGQCALAALDAHVSDQGIRQIRLRVAIENTIAKHVYESCGFRATGINMFKEVAAQSHSV